MAASCGAAQSLGLEMDYRVYENWTIDKAIVHKAACRFCNDGRGIHRADEGQKMGSGTARSTNVDLAFRAAAQLNREKKRGCEKFC
jgi:hypothetical protein